MGATVNILQSDEKCVQGNVILPFLMNSYSDFEDNQYVFFHSLKEKMDEVITHFLSQLEGKGCYPKLNIFSSFSTVGHTKTICFKHCKMDTVGLSKQHPKSSIITIFSLSL